MGKHGHKNAGNNGIGILFKKIYNHMKENCAIKKMEIQILKKLYYIQIRK